MFGAIVYALTGARLALRSLADASVALHDIASESRGVGIVSVFFEIVAIPYALLAIAAIVVNWMLRGWARRSDRTARMLLQAQRWSSVVAFAVLLVEPIVLGLHVGGPWVPALIPLTGIVWGVQFLLTAALLGKYVMRTARAS